VVALLPQINEDEIKRIQRNIESETYRIQEFMLKMLRINATNPRMGGPGEVERADFIQSFLEAEGFAVFRVNVPDPDGPTKIRPNLFAKLEGGRRAAKTLWYVSHMDTVPEGSKELWQSDPFEPTVKDGKIVARGAEDNGQSLVASIFALRELKKLGVDLTFDVGVSCVSDEEFGSNFGVKYLIDHDYFKKTDLMVVPDSGSPDGTDVEIAEKNLLWLKVLVKGKQVHASLPTKGLNAHRVGIKLANALDEHFHKKYSKKDALYHEEPFSTFEPTKVEPNVANINTIPGIDIFYFDCRVLPAYTLDEVLSDVNSIVREFESRYKVQISTEIVGREDAGPPTSEDNEVVDLVTRGIQYVTNKQPKLVGIGGQTVGNLFRKAGIPTAVWSTVDDVAHEPNEYCWIKNMVSDTKVFASIPLLAQTKREQP
jgi:succinyl-diaminopimelate desuccinylase